MKIVKKPAVLQSAPAPVPPEPVPQVDVEGILTAQAKAIAKQTESLSEAFQKEVRVLAAAVINSKKGPIRVEIERDRDGYMKALIIERVNH